MERGRRGQPGAPSGRGLGSSSACRQPKPWLQPSLGTGNGVGSLALSQGLTRNVTVVISTPTHLSACLNSS